MVLETAFADALYLNWAIPPTALPPAPSGLRYDLRRHRSTSPAGAASSGDSAFFSLVLFRQVGLHLRGASWLALSYPQVDARLCVCDAAGAPSVLLLRQLVPGWVVPLGRLVGGQPFSAAVCEFPDGLPAGLPGFEEGLESAGEAASTERVWRWKFAAGARLATAVQIGAGRPGEPARAGGGTWEEEVAFYRDRTRTYWRQGEALRRGESERPATPALPVRARLEQTDWLETFVPFAPPGGWSEVDSAFLVPKVELAFAFGAARELPVAAPVAAPG